LELLNAEPVNQNAVVHGFGEKSLEENAMALSASDAVHRLSVATAQNMAIPSGSTAIGESAVNGPRHR
jgi:hypothetical protein